jgi:hypothetical protein
MPGREEMQEIRAACEDAFSFLVTEFGYRKVRGRFRWNGFEFGYGGPFVGVLVEWYPRDPLTVWLVLLVDGVFPPRYAPAGVETAPRYFDLADLAAISTGQTVINERQRYEAPNADMARIMADRLRRYAARLLRGDLAQIPELEMRIRRRSTDIADS